jgi:hypothetical protein
MLFSTPGGNARQEAAVHVCLGIHQPDRNQA